MTTKIETTKKKSTHLSQLLSEDDRLAMVDVFARLLSQHFQDKQLRLAHKSVEGFDMDIWSKMANLGLLGLLIDEEHAGLGLSIVEVEAILEEAGKVLFTSPYISSCVVAPSLLQQSDQSVVGEICAAIVTGDLIIAEAGFEDFNEREVQDFSIRAEQHAGQWTLNGDIEMVQHLNVARKCLVLANANNECAVFMFDIDTPGVNIESLPANDPSLKVFSLSMRSTQARWLTGVGTQQIQRALDLANIAQAGEQAGGSRAIFEKTIDYLKTRFQFGRPIGAFQALKHMAADLLVEVESMTSVARFAAQAAQTHSAEQGSLTSLAGFSCSEGYRHVAAEAIQMHGGIAYTTEHVAHLYWRRAQTCLWLYGSPDQHRERYLSELEDMQ